MVPAIPLLSLGTTSPKDLLEALSTTGFLHLSLGDTPLTSTIVRRAFEISSHLYDEIPESERCQYPLDDDLNGHVPLRSTVLSAEGGQKSADLKEGYGFGCYTFPKQSCDQRLPASMEPLRKELNNFHQACYETMQLLLDKVSLAFSLPEDFFRSRHTCRGSSGLTMLNYPPPPESTLITHTDIRAGAHKDWGSVTLLFQEDGGQPGLEIFLPDPITSAESVAAGGVKLMSQVDLSAGKWYPAPIFPGTVLVNTGLVLESWTAGRCVATLHRVIFPSTIGAKARRSIAFFGTPDPDVLLTPVKGGGNEGQSSRTVKEFFEERLKFATIPN